MLKKCNLQQDPLDKTIWDELTKWLKTNIGHIFNYILSMKALWMDYIDHNKICKSSSILKGRFVHQVFYQVYVQWKHILMCLPYTISTSERATS